MVELYFSKKFKYCTKVFLYSFLAYCFQLIFLGNDVNVTTQEEKLFTNCFSHDHHFDEDDMYLDHLAMVAVLGEICE